MQRSTLSLFVLSFSLFATVRMVAVVTGRYRTEKPPSSTISDLANKQGDVYLPLVQYDPTSTPTPTPTPIPTATPSSQRDLTTALEQEVADAINGERARNYLPSLSLVGALTEAARRHSTDMATHHFTGHTGSDGSTSRDRMRDAGYNPVWWAEIISWGFDEPAEVMEWWMNSAPHRAAILSSYYDEYGVGHVWDADSDWGHYWTVNFGNRDFSQATSGQKVYRCEIVVQGDTGGSSLVWYGPEPCP